MTISITKISGIGLHTANILAQHGYSCAEDLAATDETMLGKVPGFGPTRVKLIIAAARELCPVNLQNPQSLSVSTAETKVSKKSKSKMKTKKKSKKKDKKKDKKDKKEKKHEGVKKAQRTSPKKKKKKK